MIVMHQSTPFLLLVKFQKPKLYYTSVRTVCQAQKVIAHTPVAGLGLYPGLEC
jgi:hypothetical protein